MAVDRLIWKIGLDFIILAAFGIILLAIKLWAEPYHRGYFADDHSLRLPYKQNTISEALLGCLGFALNVVTIIIVEIVRDKKGTGIGKKQVSSKLIPGWVWESYNSIGIFTFGAASQQLTVNSAKYVIGRLRPHFFAVCQPVPAFTPAFNEYITEFVCAGADQAMLKDMRLSFPSAHSSFAMYAAVFFVFYIQTKSKWRGSKLLRHGVQYAVLMGAWYVGLSRVVDHMHHWSDVAVGFFIGGTYAVLTFVFVLKPKKYGIPGSWDPPGSVDHRPPPEDALPRPVVAR